MTTTRAAARRGGGAADADLDWHDREREATSGLWRDWKRLVLVIGLGALSWVATYVGMLELIEANIGELPLLHKAIVGFSVAMLMVMVVWLLDQIFSDISWLTRLIFIAGYLFLTVISVGFGFGFYWKVLESKGEASRSAESAVGQVQNALHAGVTRLEQLQGTLDALTRLSAEKAGLERQSGTSCPGSRPGDGPRRQLREDDAARFKFAADFVRGRVGAIRTELAALGADLAKVTGNDRSTVDGSGTRNEFMRALNRRLDMTVTGFNAFRSDPQLKQMRTDLAERSDRVTFPDTRGGTFQCPDAQLSAALKGVVRAIDELPSLEKPKIAAVEGSEAVIEAFRRLSATMFGALSFKLPPSPEELRELQKKAVQSVEGNPQTQARLNAMAEQAGLSRRDYIPLAVALFVDLCLLLVSIKRTGSPLERLLPRMRAAERGPVIQILSRFNDIHRDKEIRESFEVFRHVVFDYHGDYYAAVPLNAPYRANPRNGRQAQGYGVGDAEELLQEAHLLVNLFASFEKERIFTRVMSPLLTTATVQRRLRRQGSKFANAEAFRIYRFRDGAWSDIILGAVMGAARRVEEGERRRRREAGPGLDVGSLPDPTAPRQPVGGNGAVPWQQAAAARDAAGIGPAGRHLDEAQRTPFMPRIVPASPDTEAPPPRRPANSNTAPGWSAEEAPPQVETGHAENVFPHPVLGRTGNPPPRSPVAAADAQVRAGDTEHGTLAAEAITPVVVPRDQVNAAAGPVTITASGAVLAVAPAAAEPTVTVAAMRETVTYTLPVSEARLPSSLLGPRPGPDVQVTEPPPAAALADPGAEVAVASEPAVPAGVVPDDARALALRFGPSGREG